MNEKWREIGLFIKESMNDSKGQEEYYLGARRFLKEKFGKKSPILKVVELLHHPQNKFKKRAFVKFFGFVKEASVLEVWKLIVELNRLKNSEEFKSRKIDDSLAITYFYDIKVFLINLLFLMMLQGGNFFQLTQSNQRGFLSVYVIKKDGILMSFDERFAPSDFRSKEKRMLRVNCEECAKTNHDDLLMLSRGVHIFPNEIDPLVFLKLEKLKRSQRNRNF